MLLLIYLINSNQMLSKRMRKGNLVLIYCFSSSPVMAYKLEKVQNCCSLLVSCGKVGELLTLCLVLILVWTTSYVMLGRVAIPTDQKLDSYLPFLFGLIGTEKQVEALEADTVAQGLLVIIGGLMVRLVVSYLSVFRAVLDHKERIFVAVAWLPKATAQAAIGSFALDQARKIFKMTWLVLTTLSWG